MEHKVEDGTLVPSPESLAAQGGWRSQRYFVLENTNLRS